MRARSAMRQGRVSWPISRSRREREPSHPAWQARAKKRAEWMVSIPRAIEFDALTLSDLLVDRLRDLAAGVGVADHRDALPPAHANVHLLMSGIRHVGAHVIGPGGKLHHDPRTLAGHGDFVLASFDSHSL